MFAWTILYVTFFDLVVTDSPYASERWSLNYSKPCPGTNNRFVSMCGRATQLCDEYLLSWYKNCTYVQGNLELTNIKHPLPDGLFDHIEEVKGYVLLFNVGVRVVSMPKLRVIWGDQSFFASSDKSASLYIQRSSMEILDMSSLRSIVKGRVYIDEAPYLCHWRTIDWKQILGTHFSQRLNITAANHGSCDGNGLSNGKCAEECPTVRSGSSSCFGPGPGQCQIIYRNCPERCTSTLEDDRSCFNRSDYSLGCCHEYCATGCTGTSDSDCIRDNALGNIQSVPEVVEAKDCKDFTYGDKCVAQCPAKKVYDVGTGRMVVNPNGTYNYLNKCVPQCPDNMLVEADKFCVRQCSEGSAPATIDSRECVPCGDACPKQCRFHETEFNAATASMLVNCTQIDGNLVILVSAFSNASTEVIRDGTTQLVSHDPLESHHLAFLNHVRVITGYLMIQTPPENVATRVPMKNLDFLTNLEEVQGRVLYKGRAVFISSERLEYLGLKNLKRVSGGSIFINAGNALCYVHKIPWTSIGSIGLLKFRNAELCEQDDNVCDAMCNTSLGCWGPGRDRCFECMQWKLGDECIDTCDQNTRFTVPNTKLCQECDAQCDGCTGPTNRECKKCRNVRRMSDLACVESCPNGFYSDSNHECQPCNNACHEKRCTGPGLIAGPGGCDRCIYGVEFGNGTVECVDIRLQATSNCAHVIASENLTNYYIGPRVNPLVEYLSCLPCNPLCSTCTGPGVFASGPTNDNCWCRKVQVYRSLQHDYCAESCPSNFYNQTMYNRNAVCHQCDAECDGCYEKGPRRCHACLHMKHEYEPGQFECLQKCPKHKPFPDADRMCLAVDMLALHEERERQTQVVAGIVCGVLLIVLVGAIVGLCVFRKKIKILKWLNTGPPEIEMEPNPNAKPNLSRLRLIRETELRCGDILGYGAFGTVYKGVWIPPNDTVRVPVAIKLLHEANASTQQEMLDEAGNMARMEHPHLVRLVGVCLGQQMRLVTPLMPLGNLLEYVQNNRSRIGSMALVTWCYQIADGMTYLEENRLVHRDLAARNVLVQKPFHVRVSDFGLAKLLDFNEEEYKAAGGKMPIKWLALECIQFRRFTHKSDVWAFGVTVWELLTFGDKPYADVPVKELPDRLEKGERLRQPEICTLDLYMMLIKCWMVDADSRPSFRELQREIAKMLKDPARYLVVPSDTIMRLPSFTPSEQQEVMRELMQQGGGDLPADASRRLVDAEDYLTSEVPPGSPRKVTQPTPGANAVARRVGEGRHPSVGSQRYASDPLKHARAKGYEAKGPLLPAMDNDNYLVPNHSDEPSSSPKQESRTEAQRSYYNDLNVPRMHVVKQPSLDNLEYMKTQHGAELVQAETVV